MRDLVGFFGLKAFSWGVRAGSTKSNGRSGAGQRAANSAGSSHPAMSADRLKVVGRGYHFSYAISLKIAFSKLRSATAHLSRAFSFSSWRSLLSAPFLTPP